MSDSDRVKISAVIITLNEAHRIEPTLESLVWCDEILVVDSGSSDDTVALCRAHGCRVLHHEFTGYGAQKRFAVSQAAHDWVLAIDADEVINPELQKEIQRHFRSDPAPTVGFVLPRTLVFMGRQFRFGAEHRRPYLRLFDRRHGNFNEEILHEGVEVRGDSKLLRGTLLHHSYSDITAYFAKFNRYTGLASVRLEARGRRADRTVAVLVMPLSFAKIYLLQGNFLNGFPGFVWALFSSMYAVVRHLKLYELNHPEVTVSPPEISCPRERS